MRGSPLQRAATGQSELQHAHGPPRANMGVTGTQVLQTKPTLCHEQPKTPQAGPGDWKAPLAPVPLQKWDASALSHALVRSLEALLAQHLFAAFQHCLQGKACNS